MGENRVRFWVYGIAILIAVLSVVIFPNIAGEPTKQTAPAETVQEAETAEVQQVEATPSPSPALENIAPEVKEDPKEEVKTEPAPEDNPKDK